MLDPIWRGASRGRMSEGKSPQTAGELQLVGNIPLLHSRRSRIDNGNVTSDGSFNINDRRNVGVNMYVLGVVGL